MNLHEFYEKGNNSYLTHLRGYLLSGAMCHFFDMYLNITEKTTQKIAIIVFANLFKGERIIYVLPFLLPHLSFSGNKFEIWSGLKRLIDYFFAIFVRADSSAWIDLRDSIKKCM